MVNNESGQTRAIYVGEPRESNGSTLLYGATGWTESVRYTPRKVHFFPDGKEKGPDNPFGWLLPAKEFYYPEA